MAEEKNNKILDLLAKLIRQEQGERTIGNLHAAERFAAKVQDLLKRYSLSMGDVLNSDNTSSQSEPINHVLFKINDNNNTCAWQSVLLRGIAKANDCETLLIWGTNKYYVIGTETQRIIVLRLFVYFSDLAEHLANKERNERKESVRFRNGYLYGFASGVANRMVEASKQVQQEAETGRKQLSGVSQALIRLNDTLVKIDQHKSNNFPNTQTKKQRVKFELSGFQFGRKVANKVALTSSTMKATV